MNPRPHRDDWPGGAPGPERRGGCTQTTARGEMTPKGVLSSTHPPSWVRGTHSGSSHGTLSSLGLVWPPTYASPQWSESGWGH